MHWLTLIQMLVDLLKTFYQFVTAHFPTLSLAETRFSLLNACISFDMFSNFYGIYPMYLENLMCLAAHFCKAYLPNYNYRASYTSIVGHSALHQESVIVSSVNRNIA